MKDLIVVGAGPVGSQLAKKFSEKDDDVLMIERSSSIGEPLACSGHVSPDIRDFLPDDDFEAILQNGINGADFHLEGKYRFFRERKVSYVIDRIALDEKKAEQAQESGAELHVNETVQSVEEKEDNVLVETDTDSYKAKMVAGCDGASSKVRDETGLPEPDHFYQGVLCFTDEEDSSDFVDVTLDVPSFFGWRIPRGDSVEYGAAVPKGENPMEWLDNITDRFNVDDRKDVCAGAIPVGPPDSVTSDRVFLVGDAAAQTKPFTGGGILYGMRSSNIACEKIDVNDPDTLGLYESAWRSELNSEIRLGKLIEKFYSLPSFIQKPALKVFQGEIGVHMDRPSSLFSLTQFKAMLPNEGLKSYLEDLNSMRKN